MSKYYRPQRLIHGVYALEESDARRAIAFIRRHATDAQRLIEILGLSQYDQANRPEAAQLELYQETT